MVGRGSLLIVVAGVLTVTFFLGAVPPATAQDGDTANATDPCAEAEQLDATLELCSAELDDGDAVIVLRSSITQEVRLTDMAAATGGGDVPFRDVALQPGEMTTVRFDVSKTDEGKAGVSVSAERSMRSIILDDEDSFIGGPWRASDARDTSLGAGTGTAFITVVTVLRRIHGEDDPEPRVLAS